MMDLARLIADACADLDDGTKPVFSSRLEKFSSEASPQPTDNNSFFQSFQSFQSKTIGPRFNIRNESKNEPGAPCGGARAYETYSKTLETLETLEKEVKTPTDTDTYFFPVVESPLEKDTPLLEKVGQYGGLPAGTPEVAGLVVLPAPLPISADQVRKGVERELRDLAAHGRTGPGALRDAIAITRAKIRNSTMLHVRQSSDKHCIVCNGTEEVEHPFVPVLSGSPGRVNWLHTECHSVHVRRITETVDAIMTAAGYGDERSGRAA